MDRPVTNRTFYPIHLAESVINASILDTSFDFVARYPFILFSIIVDFYIKDSTGSFFYYPAFPAKNNVRVSIHNNYALTPPAVSIPLGKSIANVGGFTTWYSGISFFISRPDQYFFNSNMKFDRLAIGIYCDNNLGAAPIEVYYNLLLEIEEIQ